MFVGIALTIPYIRRDGVVAPHGRCGLCYGLTYRYNIIRFTYIQKLLKVFAKIDHRPNILCANCSLSLVRAYWFCAHSSLFKFLKKNFSGFACLLKKLKNLVAWSNQGYPRQKFKKPVEVSHFRLYRARSHT